MALLPGVEPRSTGRKPVVLTITPQELVAATRLALAFSCFQGTRVDCFPLATFMKLN